MLDISVVILAAGKGTRMKSKKPKCAFEIANKSLMQHSITSMQEMAPKNILCVISPDQEILKEQAAASGIEAVMQKDRLGTGHAVLTCQEKLQQENGLVVVTYGDTPFVSKSDIAPLVDIMTKDDNIGLAVLGFHEKLPNNYGRLVMKGENLQQIVEAKDATQEQLNISFVNSGIMVLRSPICWSWLHKLNNNNKSAEYYLTDCVAIAINDGYKAVALEGNYENLQGINDRYQLSVMEGIFQQRARYKFMMAGVTLQDPNSVYFSHDTQIGEDVLIEPNVYFGKNVKIGDNTHIKAYSHIDSCNIGSSCIIGPFARIRPDSEIKDEAKLGNFIEIKKSTIGKGSKVPHLTYIGDTNIGEKSNIGAGTITCNYDGFFKYTTNIGDGVFVGSNSTLISPVTIEDNAYIGAGSVIAKDTVASGSLALSRAKRKDIKGWATSFNKLQMAKKLKENKK